MSLRHGGMGRPKRYFAAHLVISLAVKKFYNRLIFREVIATSRVSCFLAHSVYAALQINRYILCIFRS